VASGTRARSLYSRLNGTPREQQLEWRFPTGAAVSFAHMEWERNRYDWQGSQICLIGFDELTHFRPHPVFFTCSAETGAHVASSRVSCMATTNPDADSWVAEFIEWWIDQETGYPIPDRAGKLRWFVQAGDELVWADSAEELKARYPDAGPDRRSRYSGDTRRQTPR